MKIIDLKEKRTPRLVSLVTIKPGEVFSCRDATREELMSSDPDSPGLWMKCRPNGEKTGRVTIVNLKTGELAERDADHKVIPYDIQIAIGETPMVEE
jgi:hypothetical protein